MRKGEKMSPEHKAAIARGRRRYLRGLNRSPVAQKATHGGARALAKLIQKASNGGFRITIERV
jgi:TRAP-type mannitol/chloroaromatic compound transport system substrate-binding protein